jgi:phosphoribosylglycinamide formyltransferase-1
MLKLGVLASGRGSNLGAIIRNVESGRLSADIRVVISDHPDTLALKIAQEHGIAAQYIPPGKNKTFLEPDAEEKYVNCLREHKIELVVLAGFMRILKSHFLNSYSGRIMNIHPALLPSFPGLDAQKQALLHGVKYSGCTVHFVTDHVDGGPIIKQAVVPVLPLDTVANLSERILDEEHRIYSEAIQLFSEGRLRIEGRRVIILE